MNASELIQKLNEIMRVHGDMPVQINGDPILAVAFKSDEKANFVVDVTPEHVPSFR